MTKIRELECLCGARERDEGQARPRKCWACGSNTMGSTSYGKIPRLSPFPQSNECVELVDQIAGVYRNGGVG